MIYRARGQAAIGTRSWVFKRRKPRLCPPMGLRGVEGALTRTCLRPVTSQLPLGASRDKDAVPLSALNTLETRRGCYRLGYQRAKRTREMTECTKSGRNGVFFLFGLEMHVLLRVQIETTLI